MAIPLPTGDRTARMLMRLSTVALLASALVVTAVLLFGAEWIQREYLPDGNRWLVWVLPIWLLLAGVQEIAGQWLVRREAFGLLALSNILRASSAAGAQALAGLRTAAASGLVIGALVGQAIGTALMLTASRMSGGLRVTASVAHVKLAAIEYSDFPKYTAPHSLLSALSQNLPIFLLAFFYGPHVAGLFVLAMRLVGSPAMLLSRSVGQVLIQRAAAESNAPDGDLESVFRRTTIGLSIVVGLALLPLALFGPQLFGFLLSQRWVEAGHYSRLLVPLMFFLVVNRPAVVMTQVLRRQRALFVFGLIQLATRIAVLVAGGLLLSPAVTIGLYGLSGAAVNLLLILFVNQCLRPGQHRC